MGFIIQWLNPGMKAEESDSSRVLFAVFLLPAAPMISCPVVLSNAAARLSSQPRLQITTHAT
jgi:hypothetical protein